MAGYQLVVQIANIDLRELFETLALPYQMVLSSR